MKFIRNTFKIRLVWLAVMLLLASATGCYYEPPGSNDHGDETAELLFSATTANFVNATPFGARSVNSGDTEWDGEGLDMSIRMSPLTRADEIADETFVMQLWVFQFSGTPPNKFIASSRADITDVTEAGGRRTYSFKASLKKSASPTPDQLFFVANSYGPAPGFDLTDFSATNPAGFQTIRHFFTPDFRKHLPMVLAQTNAPHSISSSVPAVIADPLTFTRSVAKISLTVTNPNGLDITLQTVQLQNSTIDGRLYPADSQNEPEVLPGMTAGEKMALFQNYTAVPVGFGETLDWYTPLNNRGSNSAVTNQKNKSQENDPSWDGANSYATRLVTRGTYKNAEGVNRGMKITIYPGANILDSYQVLQNVHYDISVVLGSLGDDDDRIEFTPYITYQYFYEDENGTEPYDGKDYTYFATAYNDGVVDEGDVFPVPTSAILDAKWGDIPVSEEFMQNGTYQDWVGERLVSSDNSQNVVKIYYKKVEPKATIIVSYKEYGTGNEIAPQDTYAVAVGPYTISSHTIALYEYYLTEIDGGQYQSPTNDASGMIAQDQTVYIVFYYIKTNPDEKSPAPVRMWMYPDPVGIGGDPRNFMGIGFPRSIIDVTWGSTATSTGIVGTYVPAKLPAEDEPPVVPANEFGFSCPVAMYNPSNLPIKVIQTVPGMLPSDPVVMNYRFPSGGSYP